MFERYKEETRRAIFFSIWEARQASSAYIEPEHLLLSLTHEAGCKANQLFALAAHTDDFRNQLGLPLRAEQTPKSRDLPLSNSGKRVLAYTAEEAERLSSMPIGTEHLLLGLLREKKSAVAAALADAGVDLHSARNRIREDLGVPSVEQEPEPDTEAGSRKSLRPFAAFFLLVIVLSLIYVIVRLVHF